MRNALVIVAALCVGGALVGCSNQKTPAKKPAGGQNPVATTKWTLKFKATCPETVEDAQCIGKYGFSVSSDGHFEAGSATGAGPSGTIKEEELIALNNAMSSALSLQSYELKGHETVEETGNEETVSISKASGADQVLIQLSGSELSYGLNNAADAQGLLQTLRLIAEGHYSPSQCEEMTTALKALYSQMQTCSVDADCSYIDGGLEVVAPSSNQWMPLDSCMTANPLSVGNATLVAASKDKLEKAAQDYQSACAATYLKEDCTPTGFTLNGQPSVCSAGKCKPSPSQLSGQ
jgi:hypothetical protein